ncbi:hypothetical protein ACFL6S_19180 [Candidatus Poribacteria bacterium]
MRRLSLCVGGAEYLLDDGEIREIVLKGERRVSASSVPSTFLTIDNRTT